MNLRVRRRPVRYARIEVKPDGEVIVTAPEGFDVESFLQRNSSWLEGKMAEIDGLRELAESGFPVNGEFYGVVRGRKARIHERFKTVVLPPYPDELREELKRFLRPRIEELIESYAGRMGVSPGKLFIRSQRTRWGSCSGKGNLNFNLRLAAVPPELREYVVVHELAHLKHRNHSRAFWDFVLCFYPDYRPAREELNKWWGVLELNPYWRWLEGRE
ncbi:M48 family metallopeptidase [Thermococcus sp. Bubb.Bath]|uniref:M48 family metallopeptidase n=1 Tax=Thermococcus sp. Bubb.Bath TaxID=1638242 RepID=UPI00143BEDC0|nr:SprT family zinc-dependent metalloprotease [Thermococcus sp. Bubb.Bath]NJF25529.1 M48 family peptidase [Thermococcus sp. Bubb.Bath]